jgi:hypothetical protein
MRSTWISLLLVSQIAFGATVKETVQYPNQDGFKSITYESEFFGYQSGINRDFTDYGRSFAEPVSQDLGWTSASSVERGKVQVAMADFNGDGLDDIAGYTEATGEVTWLEGKGDGTFGDKHTLQVQPKGRFVAGDFNGDKLAEIGVAKSDKLYISDKPETLKAPKGQMVAGDFDGDGLADICVYGDKGKISLFLRKKDGGFEQKKTEWPGKQGWVTAADFNGDHYCDLAVYGSTQALGGFAFRFGRGDGTFGPTKQELLIGDGREYQLETMFPWFVPDALPVAGQVDDDGSADIGLYEQSTGKLLTRREQGPPAYDYSVDLMKDGDKYRMWYGGRWRTVDKNGDSLPNHDGDHVLSGSSPDGRTWYRRIDAPEFPKGDEIGFKDWWTNNYLEPEVLKVNGIYHMFWQAEIDPGQRLDGGGLAARQTDRIGISVSLDGVLWQRKTNRGVVINIPDPTVTNLDHEEAVYVPDDKDGKPWWLYTFHFIDGKAAGHIRIRSSDPSTFDWNAREPVSGMSQIGNQIGYADEAPSGRMFFRITFTGNKEGRTVPTLQLSRDGLNWFGGDKPMLASTMNNKNNKNVYFLGLSTIDGTGKIERLKDGRFHALYGATTCNGPGQPDIWFAEIGIGEVYFGFNKD